MTATPVLRRCTTLAIFCAMALSGAACGFTSSEGTADGSGAGAASGVAASPGKASAPVDLRYTLASRPEPGVPFAIDLQVTPRRAVERLTVSVNAEPALGLAETVEHREGAMQARESRVYAVRMEPLSTGVHYVNVIVTLDIGGEARVRTFAVPVQVGGEAAAKRTPAGVAGKDAEGDAIVSLPAREEE